MTLRGLWRSECQARLRSLEGSLEKADTWTEAFICWHKWPGGICYFLHMQQISSDFAGGKVTVGILWRIGRRRTSRPEQFTFGSRMTSTSCPAQLSDLGPLSLGYALGPSLPEHSLWHFFLPASSCPFPTATGALHDHHPHRLFLGLRSFQSTSS